MENIFLEILKLVGWERERETTLAKDTLSDFKDNIYIRAHLLIEWKIIFEVGYIKAELDLLCCANAECHL